MHYSYGQSPKALKDAAVYLTRGISEAVQKNPFVLVYSGFSGASLATALSLQFLEIGVPEEQFGMAYVRKRKEYSHGEPVEFYAVNSTIVYDPSCVAVFVDDFLETGETLLRTFNEFLKFTKKKRPNKQFNGRFMLALSGSNSDGTFFHNSPEHAGNFHVYKTVASLRKYSFDRLDLS